MTKKIQTPLTRDAVRTLKAGDSCLITGVIYTARDAPRLPSPVRPSVLPAPPPPTAWTPIPLR